ncbi:hypothetical protein ACWGTO_29825 [Mesorhizobium sp. PL10]
MGMHSHRLEPGEAADIAMLLPRAKLFDSGKAFVPLVKGDLCRRILDLVPLSMLVRLHN